MAPNIPSTLISRKNYSTLSTADEPLKSHDKSSIYPAEEPYRVRLVWRNIMIFAYLYCGGVYGFYLMIFHARFYTFIWSLLVTVMSGFGITAGAHRLWTHRSYKAKWPLRLILAIFQTMALQNCIYEWCRDHRVHHKFSETDADPHNASRGFFFSHIGWLFCRKHPDVIRKGATVDMSDLEKDPIVVWQKRTYKIVVLPLCFVFPAWVSWYFWNEPCWTAFYVAGIMRYIVSLNFAWLVNSAAHIWGTKPYDKDIGAVENKSVGIFTFGEGWHNYHHIFPWDYKAAELGNYSKNLSTGFIDFFAWIGWAYDLKSVSVELIRKRIARTGDGSHPDVQPPPQEQLIESPKKHNPHDMLDDEIPIWGWGDQDMLMEDAKLAVRENRY